MSSPKPIASSKTKAKVINLARVQESCKHCKYFLSNVSDEYGYCRRFPPTVIATEDGQQEAVQPTVTDSEYCGEFKPKN